MDLSLGSAAAAPWSAHDTRLVVVALVGIAIIVLLIVLARMHPFLSLLVGSAFVGIAAGVPSAKIITNFETGVGSTLMEVGLLIALGAMLGKLLADSGGADRVIDTLLARTSGAAVPWAMALVAVIIGLPMFFEIGLVLLLPVIVLVTQRSGLRLMRVAIPALAGLSVLHGLIPPHPGPLIAISAVHAQLGTTLALGLARRPPDGGDLWAIAVDPSSPGGCRWARRAGRRRRHHHGDRAQHGRPTAASFPATL